MNNTVKRHEILKYIIDNDLLGYNQNQDSYVCHAIEFSSNALNDASAGNYFVRHIRTAIAPNDTVTGWLEFCNIVMRNRNHLKFEKMTELDALEYRKKWVQAMYEACLKKGV